MKQNQNYLIYHNKNTKLSTELLAFYHQNVKEVSYDFNCYYRDNTCMAWQPGLIETYKKSKSTKIR